MKFIKLLLAISLVSTSAFAGNLVCPTSVKAGTALTITSAIITNNDCNNPLIIQDTVVSLLGNSGGTLGLQGPFVTAFSTSLPVANCQQDQFGNTSVSPTTHQITSIPVVSKVPAAMAGTLIAVAAGVKDSNNNLIMLGACQVNVTH